MKNAVKASLVLVLFLSAGSALAAYHGGYVWSFVDNFSSSTVQVPDSEGNVAWEYRCGAWNQVPSQAGLYSEWAYWLTPPSWQGQTSSQSSLGPGVLHACAPGAGDQEPFLVWKSNVTGTVQVAITMGSDSNFQVHFLKNDDALDGAAPTSTYSYSQPVSVVPGDRLTLHVGSWGNYPTVNTAFTVTLLPAALEGEVSLGGYLGDNATVGVEFDLAPVAGGATITRFVMPDAAGHFRVANIDAGQYNVSVKTDGSLRVQLNNVNIQSDPTVLPGPIVLQLGDINGDNGVSFEDFSILQNSYGQTGTNPLAAAAALASGGCGSLGMVLMSLMGLAIYGLGLRVRD